MPLNWFLLFFVKCQYFSHFFYFFVVATSLCFFWTFFQTIHPTSPDHKPPRKFLWTFSWSVDMDFPDFEEKKSSKKSFSATIRNTEGFSHFVFFMVSEPRSAPNPWFQVVLDMLDIFLDIFLVPGVVYRKKNKVTKTAKKEENSSNVWELSLSMWKRFACFFSGFF